MKVMVEIDDDIVRDASENINYITLPRCEKVWRALAKGIVFPTNATNGDVVKIIFPDIEIYDSKAWKRIYTGIPFGNLTGANLDAMREWWEALYKR